MGWALVIRKESDSNDNLLKQWIEAENSHDVEKVLTLLTDDVVIRRCDIWSRYERET